MLGFDKKDMLYIDPTGLSLIFKDAKTEGRKAGMSIMGSIYEPIVEEYENKCRSYIASLEDRKNTLGEIGEDLINTLKKLEAQKAQLEKEKEEKEKNVSKSLEISEDKLKSISSAAEGCASLYENLIPFIFPMGPVFSFIQMKKHEYKKGFFQGVDEGEKIVSAKIKDIQKKYEKRISKGNTNIESLLSTIFEINDEIIALQQEIIGYNLIVR